MGQRMKKKFDRDEDYDEVDGMGFCYAIIIALVAFGLASWFFG